MKNVHHAISCCALPALSAIVLMCLLSGCTPPVSKSSSWEKLAPATANETQKPYTIGAGDELEVKFFFAPELNDVMQVRPDGKISLMFAQDIQAAGKTPEELAADIRRRLQPHVRQPELVVVMRSYASQKAFVGGEVLKAGPVQLAGHENLLQVLDEAGWITPAADHDVVLLMRRDEDGKESVYPLNLGKVMNGQDMKQNVIVQAGDVVLVPPSGVTSFDRWIDQYIRQAVPLNSGVIITNQVNNSGL